MTKAIQSAHHFIKEVSPYLLIFLLFFPLTWMNPRSNRDDYDYAFSWDKRERLESIIDYFPSAVEHYMSCNGRVWSNSIATAFFSANELDNLFRFLNACIFTLLIYLSIRYLTLKDASKQPKTQIIDWKQILGMALLFWFLAPIPGESMLWMCGSLNYLWVATFSMLFLCILSNLQQTNYSKRQLALLFPICLLCGWGNEAFSAPIFGASILYGLLHRKSVKIGTRLLFPAFALGALIMIFAPGTLHRASNSLLNTKSIVLALLLRIYVLGRFMIGLKLKATILLALGLFGLYIRQRNIFKAFCAQYQFLLLCIGCGIIFFTLITYVEDRGLWGIELFSILTLYALIRTIMQNQLFPTSKRYKQIIMGLILLFFAIDYCTAAKMIYYIGKGERIIMEEYQRSTDGLIRSPFTPQNYQHRFVCYINTLEAQYPISLYYHQTGEKWKPFHLIPAPFFDTMAGNNNIMTDNNRLNSSSPFFTLPDELFYMTELTDSDNPYPQVIREYKFNDDFWLRQIAPTIVHKIEEFYSRTNLRVTYLQMNNKRYLFVNKIKRSIPGLKLRKLEIKKQL